MTQTQTEDSSGEPEKQVTKKVDLVCYLKTEDGETRRQFANRVDDERDYFDKDESVIEEVDYYIKAKGVEAHISEDQFEAFSHVDLGDARLSREVTENVEREFTYRPSKPLDMMVQGLVSEVYDGFEDPPSGWEESTFGNKFKNQEGDGYVSTYTDFERMPMLKHKSEITPDDMYVDEDEDYLTLKVKVAARNVEEDVLGWIDENFISVLMTKLGRHEWVDRVRMYDCEQKTQEKGVCFNI